MEELILLMQDMKNILINIGSNIEKSNSNVEMLTSGGSYSISDVCSKLDSIESTVDSVYSALNSTESTVDSINFTMNSIESKVDSIDSSASGIELNMPM